MINSMSKKYTMIVIRQNYKHCDISPTIISIVILLSINGQ